MCPAGRAGTEEPVDVGDDIVEPPAVPHRLVDRCRGAVDGDRKVDDELVHEPFDAVVPDGAVRRDMQSRSRPCRAEQVPHPHVLGCEERLAPEELGVSEAGEERLEIGEEPVVVRGLEPREPGPVSDRRRQFRCAHDTGEVAAVRQREGHRDGTGRSRVLERQRVVDRHLRCVPPVLQVPSARGTPDREVPVEQCGLQDPGPRPVPDVDEPVLADPAQWVEEVRAAGVDDSGRIELEGHPRRGAGRVDRVVGPGPVPRPPSTRDVVHLLNLPVAVGRPAGRPV